VYSALVGGWQFADDSSCRGPILLRNAVFHEGKGFEVRSVSPEAFPERPISAVCISKNVESLGAGSFATCSALEIVAFESGSHLSDIGADAFRNCDSLRSIAIPSLVRHLASACLADGQSLQSVLFEPGSKLATIDGGVFPGSPALHRLLIPASLTAMDAQGLTGSGISSIEIEPGSASFSVRNGFLLDFSGRSLLWVLGSPESILIPSCIEELRRFFCGNNEQLKTVRFESGSTLRFIQEFAFAYCESLESICIPSSVEVLQRRPFGRRPSVGMITFAPESKLRVIEKRAFHHFPPGRFVSVPASVRVIGRYLLSSVSRP
jgi:hypothetical protein